MCLPTEPKVTSAVTIRQRSAVSRRGQKRIQTHRNTCCWRSPAFALTQRASHSSSKPPPDTPVWMFRGPPEALAARKHQVYLTNLLPTGADHKEDHPSPPPSIPSSSLSPSPSLFSSVLRCPVLRCWDWRCPWRWMLGNGPRVRAAEHPWQGIGLHSKELRLHFI